MTDKARIEKDAITYVIQETGYQVLPEHDQWKKAFIAGAESERNKVIDLLLRKLDGGYKDYVWYKHLRLEIESINL